MLTSVLARLPANWAIHSTRLACMSTAHTVGKEKPKGPMPTNKQILMKLRRKTGFPIMKCKQALVSNDYDFNMAMETLKAEALKEGWSKMESLSTRVASQGLVTAYRDEKYATLVEVNCESDFVAKTSEFQSLVGTIAQTVLHHFSSPMKEKINLTTEELMKLKVPDKDHPVEDLVASTIGKLKENIKISRGVVLSANKANNELIGVYTHPEMGTPRKGGRLPLMGKYAALVSIRSTALESQGQGWLNAMGRDISQHIVGMNPTSMGTPGPVHQADCDIEKSAEKTRDSLGPPNLDQEEEEEEEYSQVIEDSDELLKQPFLLDANITVQNWLDINQLAVTDFVRYHVGGLQDAEEE